MHLNSLLFSTLLLYTTCIHSYVIPKHDFITLPLLKRLPSSSIIEKRAATSEQSKLYNADNVEYLTKLYIGTPPQEFLVSIDTGSADTWVPSSECPSSQCPYKRFDQEKSSTYQPLNISFAINYAQGSVHGSYAKEKMNLLGPESTNNITSPEQTIGLSHSAKEIISGGMEMTSNGILGLAFPALAANSDTLEAYKPFLFELAAKKIISQPVFSISLNEKEGWQSELTIGGINRDKFTGEIRYLPVVKNVNPKTAELDYTFWSVELKGIQIDQKNNLKVNQKVTLDTGTTYSYLSKELVDQIVQDVTQQKPTVDLSTQLYTVDCKLRSSNHTIQFEFDNLKISILLRDFILKPSNEESTTQCGLSLSYNYDENETFVLGDNFLRSAFFLFDIESKRVGIATAINSSSKVFST